ncbi:hypothetical protein [Rhodococcus sp. (in: high G+C Gram-positive bacteria)]|uniref:hypothetical protein n=1 Tax=Rhodococcus sp. TaxID=1831 RepID=UPI00338DE1AA|nr:hypothetical protein [Rhodococcus sp. (in: high G+C Gram-positive bacteria)]
MSKPPRPRGVRTAKPVPKQAPLPVFALAEAGTWEPARLFSVIGVGSGDEQRRRTTSALILTIQAVPLFARAITSRVGAPARSVEGYREVKPEQANTPADNFCTPFPAHHLNHRRTEILIGAARRSIPRRGACCGCSPSLLT